MKQISGQSATVIPWYVESEFALLANLRPDTAAQAYCAWRRGADRAIAAARSQGCDVQLMPIRLAAFRAWLACERRPDDAASRRAFLIVCATSADRGARRDSATSPASPMGRHGFRLH